MCVTARIYTPYATIQRLLSPLQTVETRKAGPLGPEPSAARLAPRAFSTGCRFIGGGFYLAVNAVEYKEPAQTRYTF